MLQSLHDFLYGPPKKQIIVIIRISRKLKLRNNLIFNIVAKKYICLQNSVKKGVVDLYYVSCIIHITDQEHCNKSSSFKTNCITGKLHRSRYNGDFNFNVLHDSGQVFEMHF